MSTEIVQNVMQMVFDNTSFEKNAGRTIETLNKLKDALNFDGAVRGLENLGASVKDAGMDKLYSGVYKVQDGFNALDVVATRVLQNITDKVQGVAENLVKEITIAPLKSGLEEYETQINSVQTILSNTNDALIEQGLTTEHDRIEKVNGVLDELNQYADMTIYNFTEMTRNIGTFTAAGVELDTAATSIKGIANLAAMSGSNSQQASTAMYQLSQAIAAGSVKLQDWNSVVNAGMGGKLFQNELIDTAKAMGVADEQFIALTEGATTFRESLSSGWISAEVLTNTLEKFTAGSEGYTKSQVEQMRQMWEARGYSKTMIDEMTSSLKILTDEEEQNLRTKWAEKGFSDEQIDHILSMGTAATDAATKVKTFTQLIDTLKEALQSGWTQSWEYIIGDFEQAKRLWTEISDILNMYIGKSADSRNKVLEEWSRAAYSYNEAGELIYAADGQIVEGGKMVADEMGGRELVIQGLRNAFQGLMEVIVYFRNIWTDVFVNGNLGDDKVRNSLVITGDTLKDLSRKFHDFTESFKKSLGTADNPSELLTNLGNGFTYFARAARHAYDGISGALSGITNIFKALFNSEFFSVKTFTQLGMAINSIARKIDDFGQAISNNFAGPAETAAKNLDGLTRFFNGLFSVFSAFKFTELDIITYGFDAFGKVLEHIIGPGETVSTVLGRIGDRLNDFGDAFFDLFMNEDVSEFKDFFNGMADTLIHSIDSIKKAVDFSGFSHLFSNILKIMSDDDVKLFDTFSNVFEGLINIFKAFLGISAPIAAAFANVFGDWIFKAVDGIRLLADRFLAFTHSLVPNEEVMTGLQHVFEGIFKVITAIADVVGNVLLAAWDGLTKIISEFLPDSSEFSTILTEWGDKLTKVSEVIETLVSGDGAPKLSDIIGRIADKFIGFFGSLKDVDLLDKLKTLFNALGDGIKHALGGTEDMSLLDTIITKIGDFLNRLKEILSDENGELDFVKVFEAGGIGAVIFKLIDFFKSIKENTNVFTGFLGVFKQIGDAFSDLTETLGEKFKTDMISSIAKAVLEIAGALFIIAMIDPAALSTAIATVAGMFSLIKDLLLNMKAFTKADAGVMAAIAGVIQTLGNSILMMSGAIAILGGMDLPSLVQGLSAVAGMMFMMVKVVEQLSKIEGDLPKVAGTLIGLAIALNLLIIPVKVLGSMDLPSLAQGLLAVAGMMAGLVGAAIALSKWGAGFKPSTAIGLILMAESIKILGDAILKVKDLEWEQLGKGLAVMAAGLIAMVGSAAIVSKAHLSDDMLAVGGSLLMLGTAMLMLTESAKGIAGIEWEDLGKLAAVLAGALIALGVASHFINGPNLLMIGGAIFLVATAISELTVTMNLAKVLAPIATSIASSISGISHSLEAFAAHAAAGAFLQFIKDAILFLPQLAVGLAQAIIALVVELGKGAAQLIGAVVEIGKAILQGVRELLPEIFGVVKEFIEQVVQLVIDEVPRIFEALGVFFTNLWAFLTEQTPNFFTWLTTLFTNLFTFLQTEAPLLVETIRIVIDTILQAIILEAPRIGETILTIIKTLLTIINTAVPEITQTIFNLILTFLQQLATFIPQITQAAIDIVVGFLDGISQNIGRIIESAANIAIAFMDGLALKMPEIVDSAFRLLISWIDGLAKAIDENHQALFDAVGKLIMAIFNAIVDGVKTIVKGAGELISGFTSEFDMNKIGEALKNIGINLVQGIINGISGFAQNLWNKATELGQGILNHITGALDEHSPSREGYKVGAYFDEGVGQGIDDGADALFTKSANVGYGVLSAFGSALNSESVKFNPSISSDISSFRDSIMNSGDMNSISLDERESMLREQEDTSLRMLKWQKENFDSEDNNRKLWEDYNALSDEDKNGAFGQGLIDAIHWNEMIAEYNDKLIAELSKYGDEDLTYNDIRNSIGKSPVYTDTLSQSVKNANFKMNNVTPSFTSSLGQSTNSASLSSFLPIDRQTNSITGLLQATNSRLDELLGSNKEVIGAINDHNSDVYLDSGVLVGSISAPMDRSLGRSATLTARGVI